MLHKKFAWKIKTPMSGWIILFRKSFGLWNRVEIYCRTGRPQMTIKYIACVLHAVYLRLKNPRLKCVIAINFYVNKCYTNAWILRYTYINVFRLVTFGDGGDINYFELNSVKHSQLLSSYAFWMWTWHFPMDPNIF